MAESSIQTESSTFTVLKQNKAEYGICSKKGTKCFASSSMVKKGRLGYKGGLGLHSEAWPAMVWKVKIIGSDVNTNWLLATAHLILQDSLTIMQREIHKDTTRKKSAELLL